MDLASTPRVSRVVTRPFRSSLTLRKAWGKHCAPLGTPPPTFVKAAVERTCGEQDIFRAECHIMLGPAYGTIHSDSSAATALVQTTLEATSTSQIAHLEHLDLLLQIWEVRDNILCSLNKIKAHQDATAFIDPLHTYECLGNRMANDTAQQVNAFFCYSLVTQLDSFHKRIPQNQHELEQVYTLPLTLTDARLRLPANDTGSSRDSEVMLIGSFSHLWIGPDLQHWNFHHVWIHNLLGATQWLCRLYSGCMRFRGQQTQWGSNLLLPGCFFTSNICLWKGQLKMTRREIWGSRFLSLVVRFKITSGICKHWFHRLSFRQYGVVMWHLCTCWVIANLLRESISDQLFPNKLKLSSFWVVLFGATLWTPPLWFLRSYPKLVF